jgi:hypothetical protein
MWAAKLLVHLLKLTLTADLLAREGAKADVVIRT